MQNENCKMQNAKYRTDDAVCAWPRRLSGVVPGLPFFIFHFAIFILPSLVFHGSLLRVLRASVVNSLL